MKYSYTFPSLTITKHQDRDCYYWTGTARVRGEKWTMQTCESVQRTYESGIPIDELDGWMEQKIVSGLLKKVRELDINDID